MPQIFPAEKFSVPAENLGNFPAEFLHDGVCSAGCYLSLFIFAGFHSNRSQVHVASRQDVVQQCRRTLSKDMSANM